ncbi:RsmE family RNA methyltransferase [Thermodesulfobacteriota bacterium]
MKGRQEAVSLSREIGERCGREYYTADLALQRAKVRPCPEEIHQTMRRIYVPPESVSADRIVFDPGSARYLIRVLRLGTGDLIEAFDGTNDFVVKLNCGKRGTVQGQILEIHEPQSLREPHIRLAFGCVRPGPVKEILRHGTELGVAEFVPIITQRAARRPKDKKARWNDIVAAAAAQSGRTRIPEVEEPTNLSRFLARRDAIGTRLALTLHPNARLLPAVLSDEATGEVTIAAGPEGGFDASEEAALEEAGFIAASLGQGVLRTETSALLAVGFVCLWHSWLKRGEATGPV